MNTDEFIKDELVFCKEIECEKNEYGQFIYTSSNKASMLNLPFILLEYKQWLVENNIVKEII